MAAPDLHNDPRIYVTQDRLRQIGGEARAISFLPHQPVRSILNGRHASRLRGRGLNFEELRTYLPGDDVRSIDWKVTARTGEPHVRVYTEERDRPVLLLVDQRQPMFFGSEVYMKSVVAAEAAAIAAARVLAQGDRVGGVVFGDSVISEHAPKRRTAALNRMLGAIARANGMLHAEGPESETGPGLLNTVLQSAVRLAHTNALVMVFSDFDGLDQSTEPLLQRLAQANDLILFNVADQQATVLPDNLRLPISDGARQAQLDTSDGRVRLAVQSALDDRLARLFDWSRRHGFPVLAMNTARPALDQLRSLFGLAGAAS